MAERPEEFDIHRSQIKHVSFGGGVHRCIGAPLAKLECEVLLQEMVRRFPAMKRADRAYAYDPNPGFRGAGVLLALQKLMPDPQTVGAGAGRTTEMGVRTCRIARPRLRANVLAILRTSIKTSVLRKTEVRVTGEEQKKGSMRRGDITRQKILDSAIDLVAEAGFTNTTTQAVLDRSHLSRGSLLHQFGTRHELMVTTGQEAIRRMLGSIEVRMSQAGGALEGLFRFPDILWEVVIEPPALALHEIQMASRWDRNLFEGLKEQILRGEIYVEKSIRAIAMRYSMVDVEGYMIDLAIISDAMPGLAARRSLASDPARIATELHVLKAWHFDGLNRRLPETHRRTVEQMNGASPATVA